MIHFFLRRKMFRDDAFFVDFQCTVLKLVSQTVLNSIQKTTFLSKEFLSTFSTQFVCVSNTVDSYATQYVMFIYEEKYSI